MGPRALAPVCCLVLAVTAAAQELRLPPPSPVERAACARKADLADQPAPLSPGSVGEPTIDVTFYRLDLRISVTPPWLQGRVTVTARSTVDTLTGFFLDLADPMTVDSVTIDGRRVGFFRYPGALRVLLGRTAERGDVVTAQIGYHGVPSPTGFGSFRFSAHEGTPWVWSLSQPYGARDWWPCKDHQADKADSVDVSVTCDARFLVGSNGRLAATSDHPDGTRTTLWQERYPIAPYLVSVALTNYASFSNWFHEAPGESLQVLNYVLPEHLAEALATLPRTVDMLREFSRLFGPYPFRGEKYGHCEFGSGGAMEHQTMTSTTTFNETTIAHELAHQWFGDMITCATWSDLWINEGFATYAEALWKEAAYGTAAYHDHMRGRMGEAFRARGPLFVRDTTVARDLFAYPRVYAKGATVLHMLRHIVGDSVFFVILRRFAEHPRYRFATAGTRDFQAVCESVAGRSLGFFFDQWIYGEGYPRYRFSWTATREGEGTTVELMLGQSSSTPGPGFFTMPVDVRFSAGPLDSTVVAMHTHDNQRFLVTLPWRPDRVEIDPGGWILRDIEDPVPPLPELIALGRNYPNPFNQGTTITISLPYRMAATLVITDAVGREVTRLLDTRMDPGTYEVSWDGCSAGGVPAASGVYFARLVTPSASRVRPMLLLR